jgi:hypothetical protein
MNPMMNDEKTLNEGLENDSENQDNMDCRSLLPFWNLIGCSPFWAKGKLALPLAFYRITAFFMQTRKSARL